MFETTCGLQCHAVLHFVLYAQYQLNRMCKLSIGRQISIPMCTHHHFVNTCYPIFMWESSTQMMEKFKFPTQFAYCFVQANSDCALTESQRLSVDGPGIASMEIGKYSQLCLLCNMFFVYGWDNMFLDSAQIGNQHPALCNVSYYVIHISLSESVFGWKQLPQRNCAHSLPETSFHIWRMNWEKQLESFPI